MKKLNFKTKARNLENLLGILENAKILPLKIIQADLKNQAEIVKEIQKEFFGKKLIIRSSSHAEDSKENSNAGAFLSLGNIDSSNILELQNALQEVAKTLRECDEILIQPMLENITKCGVAFSVDKDNFAPYFSIQYDESGSNSAITDGSSAQFMSYTHFRDAPLPQDLYLRQILLLILELENLFSHKALDIEFAYAKNGDKEELYLLQVRPLVMINKKNFSNHISLDILTRLQRRFKKLQFCHSDVLGSKTLFGVMPDWNPAEIIGLRPKRLALSLYKEIITDNIWAYQRDNYGYRKLRSHPLMHSFCGIPYIDVRLSFNSFIPQSIREKTATKLVEFYIDSLINQPYLHDKIEFDIVFSCYDFSLDMRLEKLLKHGFSQQEITEIKHSLLEVTNNIIHPKDGLYHKDLQKVTLLEGIYQNIMQANISLIDKIYWLIENCKRYGTLPFAGVARAGFVAMQFLNSLVEIGFLQAEERLCFLNTLNTKAKQLSQDVANLTKHNKEEFLKKYGHLRAGTYNILSPRYDEDFDSYFDFQTGQKTQQNESFFLDSQRMQELEKMLQKQGLKINAQEFFIFLKTAIEGRELAKFEFSKLLSRAISLIAELGDYYHISKEEMAHSNIKTILDLYASLYAEEPRKRLLEEIVQNQKEYLCTQAIKLPPLLCKEEDIMGFTSSRILPNFITQKVVCAHVASEKNDQLMGKIVLIYAADPGYDYLFSKQIAGFITCYGGANSHMAIRASELGIPAVIGVGEEIFAKCLQAKNLRIDCESEQIFYL
ncbi:PEP-utilizing enzyme [Helicobacter anatolicus]|uniref:PEP-utilizing enzyme n=1 Tax=Helicobacter anatolicus TaxID=2905874 RepID=UPI001E3EE03F|nr:PEP-utilizing enzyme [Helicobacter anatolicus]MCE3040053.1 hypothetical protein [Helicobacter anatolicus]